MADNKQMQMSVRLPRNEAHTKLTELMRKGFDTECSPLDKEGYLTITWPASLNTGKQLSKS